MAKVTITIEDSERGMIKVVADPSFETMAMMANSGHELTPAHGAAMFMLNRAREESKSKDTQTKILIPRVHGL